MNYLEVYNASEGFFGIQDQAGTEDEMLLMLDYGIFYEFIPMSEFGTPNARALTIGEVETNVNYAVVISTNGGLWRYIIGDTVRFTTLTPHRIKVTGRTKHFINTFGEELVVENAEDAITVACQKTNASVRKFTVAPLYMSTSSSGAHEWFVEFETEPASIDEFTDVLDNRLREINSDYDAKRGGDVILGRPVVHVLRAGVFYEWMASRGKLGGQNKVPVLSNTREYADEIISFIGKQ